MRISYSKGRTVNLGNFESMRVDIGIELDIEGDSLDKADVTHDRLKAWVEGKLAKEKTNG